MDGDSDSSIEGFDPCSGKWVTVNGKKNPKRKKSDISKSCYTSYCKLVPILATCKSDHARNYKIAKFQHPTHMPMLRKNWHQEAVYAM